MKEQSFCPPCIQQEQEILACRYEKEEDRIVSVFSLEDELAIKNATGTLQGNMELARRALCERAEAAAEDGCPYAFEQNQIRNL